MSTTRFEQEISKAKARIAFLAMQEGDFDRKELLRRLVLNDNVTIYTLLHVVSEHSLIDVSTDEMTLDEVLAEHFSFSPVVQELSVANGTNVRLRAGESVVCIGKEEFIALKLTEDDVVSYRSAEATLQLLKEINESLAKQMLISEPGLWRFCLAPVGNGEASV